MSTSSEEATDQAEYLRKARSALEVDGYTQRLGGAYDTAQRFGQPEVLLDMCSRYPGGLGHRRGGDLQAIEILT
jgi:hypothetical protein